jgi:hypothetical protein
MADPIIDTNPAPSVNGRLTLQKGMTALVPLTPVPFTGQYAWLAYVRIGLYGAAGYYLWKNNRSLSYIMFGAAAFSVASSLMSNAMGK